MPPTEDLFVRLGRLARKAPADGKTDELPPALATRVLAQLRAARPIGESPWERLSLRAVPVAAIVAGACVFVANRQAQAPAPDEQALAHLIVQNQLNP